MENKKILLINGQKTFEPRFIKACHSQNIECLSIKTSDVLLKATSNGYSIFHKDVQLTLEDFKYAFIRLRGKSNHMTSILVYLLKEHKVPFNDIINLEHSLSSSKITQMIKLSLHKLPIPNTIIFSPHSYKINFNVIHENVSFPCVLKTKGERGNSVWKINTVEELENKISTITEQLVMIQELVPNTCDIRALFFNGELIAAIERSSIDGFYNNVSKGGTTQQITITPEETALCITACNISELNFSGVDFVRTENGILFFELNKSPQLQGLEAATKLNVADILVSKINKTI